MECKDETLVEEELTPRMSEQMMTATPTPPESSRAATLPSASVSATTPMATDTVVEGEETKQFPDDVNTPASDEAELHPQSSPLPETEAARIQERSKAGDLLEALESGADARGDKVEGDAATASGGGDAQSEGLDPRRAAAQQGVRAARVAWENGVMEEDLERNGALAGGRRVDYCLQVSVERPSTSFEL